MSKKIIGVTVGTPIKPSRIIADNLTTDDGTKALSARQGKLLKENADAIHKGLLEGLGQCVRSINGKKPDLAGNVDIEGNSGDNGATFVPSVDEDGNLSWENDWGLPNPEPVNIKGEKGDPYTLTEEDKAEIAAQVLAAIPVYRGEVEVE